MGGRKGLHGAVKKEGDLKRPRAKKLSELQQRMQKRLDSGQFRMLNEFMYSNDGLASKKMMDENPELFRIYHTGYAEQVKRWPRNPLDSIIKFLTTQDSKLRIADLGCGEARLSREVPQKDVKSFDLIASNAGVTPCDIAKLPLQDSSVDIVVFCLSLMGTNYADFLKEARRVLVPKGTVIVAEVASRFEDHDPKPFIAGVEKMGFSVITGHPLMKLVDSGQRKQSRGGRKHKKYGEADAEGAPDCIPFFLSFAFKSMKTEIMESGPCTTQKLPELGACLYKKR